MTLAYHAQNGSYDCSDYWACSLFFEYVAETKEDECMEENGIIGYSVDEYENEEFSICNTDLEEILAYRNLESEIGSVDFFIYLLLCLSIHQYQH